MTRSGTLAPSRLRLALTSLPGVQIAIEDVRLVEPATEPIIPMVAVAAGEAPSDYVGNAIVQSGLDIDPWENRQTQYSPVKVDSTGEYHTVSFKRRPADGSTRRVSLLSVDAPPVAATDFGLAATINYGGLDNIGDFDGSAYFEMTAYFPDGTSGVVGTTAKYGRCGRISGHSGLRPMELAMHSAIRPTRLQVQLVSDPAVRRFPGVAVTIVRLSIRDDSAARERTPQNADPRRGVVCCNAGILPATPCNHSVRR